MELNVQSQPVDSVHSKVIDAVADTRGVAPVELATPLFDVVDPDSLDRLVDSASEELSVTFEYHGCRVTVRGDRDVTVTDAFAMSERA